MAVSRTLGAPSAPRGQRSGSKDPKASRSCNATATNAEHGKVEAAEPLQRLRFLHSTVAFHAAPTLALASKGLATSSNRITWTDDHFPPRAAGIPRSSGPAAMARRDSQPAACSSHCPGACPLLYSRSTGRPFSPSIEHHDRHRASRHAAWQQPCSFCLRHTQLEPTG